MAGVGAQNRDKTLFSSVTLVQSDTVPLVSWIVGPPGGGGLGMEGKAAGGHGRGEYHIWFGQRKVNIMRDKILRHSKHYNREKRCSLKAISKVILFL